MTNEQKQAIAASQGITVTQLEAILAATKPAARPKFGPETRVLELPLTSRERVGALKKIGFMALELSATTTLGDVQRGADAYNAANPGKLDAWKARRDERIAKAKAAAELAKAAE
jgi:hypothetical protein